jgi:hypothetical protein
MPDSSQEQLGELAEIHKDVRMNGGTPPQAERVARGLSDKTLQLIRLSDGNYGVVKEGDKNTRPLAYVSKALGDRLSGGVPQPQAGGSPIGAGANTPYAQGAGVTQNLSGTVMPQQAPVSQSSAIPVR